MNWNKERLVMVVTLLVVVGTAFSTMSAWSTGAGSLAELVRPRESGDFNPSTVVRVNWLNAEEQVAGGRDPFARVSSWREPKPDPLPVPSAEPLARRIPLPALVARSPRALLLREQRPPEVSDQGGDQ